MAADKKAWSWVPPLYFIEGLPNVIITSLAVLFYTEMGLGKGHSVALTSSLTLPWVLKPLWSPLVDSVSSKRKWIMFMLSIFVLCFVVLAMAPFFSSWLLISLAAFWVLGFSSATYDISADGFYMLALSEKNQAFFVGIRNTCYRLAIIFAKGFLAIFVGKIAVRYSSATGWSAAFALCAVICLVSIFVFKGFLPKVSADSERTKNSIAELLSEFARCFVSFFKRPFIVSILLYVIFYRFAEAQLLSNISLFLMADIEAEGLGLSLAQNGMVYGTIGVICLLAGGILGGVMISKYGLRRCIFPMAFALNITNLLYVLLAYWQPQVLALISFVVGIEQFGYGLGFASYMMFLIHSSKGVHKTSHYAIATGFMALGIMLPSTFSGYIQEALGYLNFFWWTVACTLVSFAVTLVAKRALAKGL